MIKKNYYHIEDCVNLSDLFNALSLLSQKGLVALMNISDPTIFEMLKKYRIKFEKLPNTGKSFTFNIFGKVDTKNIVIVFNDDSKEKLIAISQEVSPDIEICSHLYFMTTYGETILEYVVDDSIFISRYAIKSDEIIRSFCRKVYVSRYCLEDFQ